MSSDSPPEPRSGLLRRLSLGTSVYLWIVGSIVGVGGLIALTLMGGGPTDVKPLVDPGESRGDDEAPLLRARTLLGKQSDLPRCRSALDLLNTHLQISEENVPTLSSTAQTELAEAFGFTPDDFRELKSPNFTPLDSVYLENSLLFRDAVASLAIPPVANKSGEMISQTPLERVTALFAWTVRQVRLQPSPNGDLIPTANILRRGWGSARDRALVFLAALDQLPDDGPPIDGCLVLLPAESGERLWACGVALPARFRLTDKSLEALKGDGLAAPTIERLTPLKGKELATLREFRLELEKLFPEPGSDLFARVERRAAEYELYLFDPRMGLPIPGPDGKGIATLSQVRADSKVLDQLKVDALKYDVTTAQAREARLRLVCSLSSLAPRMALLQTRLLRAPDMQRRPGSTERLTLPPPIRVELAIDYKRSLESLRQAAHEGGDVGVWKPGAGILRGFVSKADGGTGESARAVAGMPMPRAALFEYELVPWDLFPAQLRNSRDIGGDDSKLAVQLRSAFATPFVRFTTEAGGPRDLILRGRLSEAVPTLVRDQEQWKQLQQRRQASVRLENEVNDWLDRARNAIANDARAKNPVEKEQAQHQLVELWKNSQPIEILLTGSIAASFSAELSYQLSLCTLEKAVRLQMRADLGERARGSASDASRAREAWQRSKEWWKEYLSSPDYPIRQSAGRRLASESFAALSEKDMAIQELQNTTGTLDDVEKLGRLWLARRLSASKP
jgi:hypothetical protein